MTTSKSRIHVYADGANIDQMLAAYKGGTVKGFTTNPTLMAKANIRDYEKFARQVLEVITDMPISFEVFADDFAEMKRQALKIGSWGKNVFVKIPITNTAKSSALPLIRDLLDSGLKLNVTAIMTESQIQALRELSTPNDELIVSVFAGRIADTGVDPMPIMRKAVEIFSPLKKSQVLWASPREVLNYYQADQIGCHIITMTDDLLKKLSFKGKPLEDFSLETVKMFYDDARRAGFSL